MALSANLEGSGVLRTEFIGLLSLMGSARTLGRTAKHLKGIYFIIAHDTHTFDERFFFHEENVMCHEEEIISQEITKKVI